MLRACTLAVCAAGLLMLIAGRQVSVARAFVAGLPAAPGREASRKSNVARRGMLRWEDITSKTDEELHELIALGAKKKFNFRLEKFRKTKPSIDIMRMTKYEIAAAKTVLQQRKPPEEEVPVKTLTEAMATDDIPGEPTYNAKAANWEFWGRAQGCQRLRNTVPKNWWWIQQYRKTGQKDYNAAMQRQRDADAAYEKDVKAYQATRKAEKTAQKAMPTQRSQDGQTAESLFAGSASAALGLSAAAALFTLAGRRR